ncbi:hypothetical protein BJ742DRAFT_238224 [Cladochytrium replicatum]|nr:hypothetical protein BJ742DRAFT_238224 [Cladochytrium replicatum]
MFGPTQLHTLYSGSASTRGKQCWPISASTLTPPGSPTTNSTNTIHVAYRPQMTDRGELYIHFRKFPGFELIGFYDTFCFVRFADRHFAAIGVAQSAPFGCVTYEAAKLNYEVPYPQPQDDHLPPSTTLHVTHLPPNYTKDELQKIFGVFPGFAHVELHGKYGYAYFVDDTSSSKARVVLRAQTNLVVSFAKNSTRGSQPDLRSLNTCNLQYPSMQQTAAMAYAMRRRPEAIAKYWAMVEEQYARNALACADDSRWLQQKFAARDFAAEFEEQAALERYDLMAREAAATAMAQRCAVLGYLREYGANTPLGDRNPITRRGSPWEEEPRLISPASSAGPMTPVTPVSDHFPGVGSAHGSPRNNITQLMECSGVADSFDLDSVRPELVRDHNARLLAMERQRELNVKMSFEQQSAALSFTAGNGNASANFSPWSESESIESFGRRAPISANSWNLFDSNSKLQFALPQSFHM